MRRWRSSKCCSDAYCSRRLGRRRLPLTIQTEALPGGPIKVRLPNPSLLMSRSTSASKVRYSTNSACLRPSPAAAADRRWSPECSASPFRRRCSRPPTRSSNEPPRPHRAPRDQQRLRGRERGLMTKAERTPRIASGDRSKPHHCGGKNSIRAPAATQPTPAARAIQRPNGVTFSKRTSSARSAIQSTFITPPTNKSAIRTQQHPTQ
jgi:hypothetical protein